MHTDQDQVGGGAAGAAQPDAALLPAHQKQLERPHEDAGLESELRCNIYRASHVCIERVDLDLECSNVCLILPGLMVSSQPNPGQ